MHLLFAFVVVGFATLAIKQALSTRRSSSGSGGRRRS